MDLLDAEIRSGQLQGIQIYQLLCIAYIRLFVDDMGIFIPATLSAFNSAKRILGCYEMGSGAKLNLLKSTVIPLVMEEILPG